MDFVSLAFFAVAVLGLGAAATVLLTRWVPLSVAELAAKHGRYAGLEAVPVRAGTPRRARVEAAINAVGSSNY
jgi:hypothetical protein